MSCVKSKITEITISVLTGEGSETGSGRVLFGQAMNLGVDPFWDVFFLEGLLKPGGNPFS